MTLAEKLSAMGAESDIDKEIRIAIEKLTQRILKQQEKGVDISVSESFCNSWSYGWGKPSKQDSCWHSMYMDKIVEHFRNEGMKIHKDYRFEVYSITISL